MASWQYHHPDDRQPLAPTNQGYYVSFPYGSNGPDRHVEPKENAATALLEFNGNQLYLWLHEISLSFALGGESAQSHHYREFYARNLTQPTVQVTGQTNSQEMYAEIAEFIRRGQAWALKPIDENGKGNTMSLTIPEGGTRTNTSNRRAGAPVVSKHTNHKHEGHHFRGHVKNIERRTTRWVNAPQFSFEFVVVTAYQGVFSSYFDDASVTKERLAMYMQIPDQMRKRTSITWVTDPDAGGSMTDASGQVVPGNSYNKGNVPG